MKNESQDTPAETIAERTALLRKPSDRGRVFPCGVEVRDTPCGFGVFSCAFIPAGTPIGRVRGIIVQGADYSSDYCIAAGDELALEPGPPFCYLNHSCEPNSALLHYVRDEDSCCERHEDDDVSEERDADAAKGWSLTRDDPYGVEDEEDGRVLALSPDENGEDGDGECFFGDGNAADDSCDADGEDGEYEEDEEDIGEELSELEQTLYDDERHGVEIWLESTKDIFPGEQLCIDYAWPGDRMMPCLCGTKSCRGWIVDPNELDELLEKIRERESAGGD